MTKRKTALKIIIYVVIVALIILLIVYINHQIHLKMETELRSPLGQIVEVDGHNMSMYIEGTNDMTLVFMSGGGTCSPILDFKSLCSLLSNQYQIAIVEKFGYGFSDIVNKSRDIDSILADTRAALMEAGLTAPYVLCPHSMSGLEALYWAQKYPDEVSAIIGLDMAVPEYYDSMNINVPIMRVASWAANIGITRFIPGISDSDAVKYGTLSDEEKEIYKAVFYSRTATVTMINETEWVRKNAEKVNSMGIPQLPMLLFISDGSGGTGFDKDTWRKIPIEYLSKVDDGKYIELDCPHYVHDYEYNAISENIKEFLAGLQDISAAPAVPEDTEPSADTSFAAPFEGTAAGDGSADAFSEPEHSDTASVSPLPAAEPGDEDLVRVLDYIPSIYVDLKYAAEDNFTGTVIYDFSDASLRYGTVKKLAEVQEELSAQGYSLKIWDAYRPVSAQFRLWEVCPDPAYVANPNKGHSGHSRGNTVDVTLVMADGSEVAMPSGFDDFSALADRDYRDIPEEAAKNALILENVMSAHGFVGYSAEWWHYADSVSYPVVEE